MHLQGAGQQQSPSSDLCRSCSHELHGQHIKVRLQRPISHGFMAGMRPQAAPKYKILRRGEKKPSPSPGRRLRSNQNSISRKWKWRKSRYFSATGLRGSEKLGAKIREAKKKKFFSAAVCKLTAVWGTVYFSVIPHINSRLHRNVF